MDYQRKLSVIEYRSHPGTDILMPIPNDFAEARSARRCAYLTGIFVTACVFFQYLMNT